MDNRDEHAHEDSPSQAPTAAAMEERYASNERVWSGQPNAALIGAVEGINPGTALDIGCGEGADAVWLAQQGWQVTAIDHAPTAVRRTEELAAENGVQINAQAVNFQDFDRAMFDLVICFFGQLSDDDVPKLEFVDDYVFDKNLERGGGVHHHRDLVLRARRR